MWRNTLKYIVLILKLVVVTPLVKIEGQVDEWFFLIIIYLCNETQGL